MACRPSCVAGGMEQQRDGEERGDEGMSRKSGYKSAALDKLGSRLRANAQGEEELMKMV